MVGEALREVGESVESVEELRQPEEYLERRLRRLEERLDRHPPPRPLPSYDEGTEGSGREGGTRGRRGLSIDRGGGVVGRRERFSPRGPPEGPNDS